VNTRRAVLCLVVALLLESATSRTTFAQAPVDERVYKATFLFNFAQFVEWPPASFADPREPIVIGVLGQDPFGTILEDLVEGDLAQGRSLTVHRFSKVEDVKVCHILFVSASERASFSRIFAALKGRPVLTVGDVPGFAAGGGIIGFVNDGKFVRMQANLAAARASGLTISSNILRLSTIVRGAGS
jgi:hypothetical protein